MVYFQTQRFVASNFAGMLGKTRRSKKKPIFKASYLVLEACGLVIYSLKACCQKMNFAWLGKSSQVVAFSDSD